ncbi:MAG: dephospho-CoA kinase [Bdellovibrionales bacterium]|nr:dephospho-CoA kinase [Bdellovibrionales bacterium]
MKVVGLTGGVACGKTAVTSYLRKKKFTVIDADEIVQNLYLKRSVLKQIQNHFQTTDKGELRNIIFSNKNARHILENILHPLVRKEIQSQIKKYKKAHTKSLIVSIPLLFEKNMQDLFDTVVVVICTEKNQLKRLMKRDGINEETAKQMIYAQLPTKEKEALANTVIRNNGSIKQLHEKIDKLIQKIR